MVDGGLLRGLERYGIRRRAGMRGPAWRAHYRLLLPHAKLVLWWWPNGDIRAVASHPWTTAGCYAFDPQPLWRRSKMKRVSLASGGDRPRHNASLALGGLDKLSALVEHCAVITYDDGEPRQVGALRVTTEGAEWCVRVSDPDSSSSFVARGETLWDALLLAELLISSERCPWSPDSFLAERAAKRKRK